MKVVLDTNVVISGIFFSGTPARIMDHWANGDFDVYATPSILKEYLEVLDRMSFERAREIFPEWTATLSNLCHLIPDEKTTSSLSRDPADDKFLLCAVKAGADYLVTGDEDLKVLKSKFPFLILTPSEFLRIL